MPISTRKTMSSTCVIDHDDDSDGVDVAGYWSPPPVIDSDKQYDNSQPSQDSKSDRAPSYSPVSGGESDEESIGDSIWHTRHDAKRGCGQATLSKSPGAPFECLPTELAQDIAVRIDSDVGLSSVMKTSPTLYSILHPDKNNCIWRQRFLARYDYPHLTSTLEFAFAYKVRQLVLQGFDDVAIGHGLKQRSGHQLDVVKDMILEAYNTSEPHEPIPTHSKNLAIFSARNPPRWLVRMMSCSFYGYEKRKYGQPNLLYDMIQICLSHLVLSPKSSVLASIPTSRDNYDLAKVYNYNKPFSTLLELLEDEPEEELQPFKSSRFPNLKSPSPTPEPEEPRYRLNTHTLLHIRNFWQRHFTKDIRGVGENTYVSVVHSLAAVGIRPQEWNRPLHEPIPFHTSWYGHYSCLHPWPKTRQDLEERQSCAEDWDFVDPMMLDVETSISNDTDMFWPEVFSSIPSFDDLMPDSAFSNEHNVTYIRGIAPFKDMKSSSVATDLKDQFPKWHPYLASRVNGFIHDVPDMTLTDEDAQERRTDAYGDEVDQPIPGWKHIVMVIWKPTTRYLLAVLDHAEEEYGGASGTQISADFSTANIWNDTNSSSDSSSAPTASVGTTQNTTNSPIANNNNNNLVNPANNNTTTTIQPTEAQVEAQMKILLRQRITSFTEKYNELFSFQAQHTNNPPNSSPYAFPLNSQTNPKPANPLPPLFSPSHICTLEESFSQIQYLDWDDGTIDYAYAYEGIVIPGGEIMMGRWWRIHGTDGLGPGREVGPDGIGVEVRVLRGQSGSTSDGDIDEESGSSGKGKGKAKAKAKAKAKEGKTKGGKIRKSLRRGKKRKASALDFDSDEDEVESEDESVEKEREEKYEFVTLVNGEESRAVNGCKGLERGPFVFWAV